MSEQLDLFSGWDSDEEDLFSLEKQQAGHEESEEVAEGEETLDNTEKEEDFFKAVEEEEESEAPKTEENSVSVITTFLKEKGYLEEVVEEGLTDEEILDSVIENKFKQTIEMLPEKNKDLIGFLMSGGDVESYLSKLEKNLPTELSLDSDIEDEGVQELVAKEALKKKGFEDDLIEEQIELLKNTGKIQSFSKKEFEIWKKEKEDALIVSKKQQEDNKKKEKEEESKNIESVKTLLEDENYLEDLPVKKELKSVLPNYIYKKDVILSNGVKISEMQKDLFYEINKNPKTLLQIATLLHSRNDDGTLNLSFLKTKAETKVVREVKDNIRRVEQKKEKTGFERGFLADLFN